MRRATSAGRRWPFIWYVLQNGLNIGVPYSVANYPAALSPATDGCRNIAGHVSHEGIVTI
jgi:hypothetical protein